MLSSAKSLLLEALGAGAEMPMARRGLPGFFRSRRLARGFPPTVREGEARFQILVYHRVLPKPDPFAMAPVTTSEFDAQMALLRRHFKPVPLESIPAMMAEGKVEPGTICVTFDDGYRDNYTEALPILRKHGIPATVYLATDLVGTGRLSWYDRVLECFRNTRARTLDWPEAGIASRDISGLPGRRALAFSLLEWLKGFAPGERDARIEGLRGKLGDGGATEPLMLDWDEVREMRRQAVDFGAHTMSHPILSTLGAAEIESEIVGSKRVIEEKLQAPVGLFAYPNGKRGDYNAAAKDVLARSGFTCAVTTNPGANPVGQDRFELLRFQPWETSINRFYARLLLETFLT